MLIQEIHECQDTLELALDALLLSRRGRQERFVSQHSLSRINTDSVYAEFTDGVRHCRSRTKSCIH
jgi:hypothetical protein